MVTVSFNKETDNKAVKVGVKFYLRYNLLFYIQKQCKITLDLRKSTKFIIRATDLSQSNCPPHPSRPVNKLMLYRLYIILTLSLTT